MCCRTAHVGGTVFTMRVFFVAAALLLCTSSARAFQFTALGPLLDSESWDYSPSWMADTATGRDRLWWCSNRPSQGDADVIKYSQTSGGVWGAPQVVLSANRGTWEGPCTCDPSVVRGAFPYAGQTYQLAMYYTASADCSSNAKIGVAFSNDGVSWVKYAGNPLISTQFPGNGLYGAGQTQAHNTNGAAAIRLWHTDTPLSRRLYERQSVDGIHFGEARMLSIDGLDGFPKHAAGLAFNPAATELYLMLRNHLGGYLSLFKIPKKERFNGKWTLVASIPLGGPLPGALFEPAFRTDVFGNLSFTTFPTIWTAFGCGNAYVPPFVDAPNWRLCFGGGS